MAGIHADPSWSLRRVFRLSDRVSRIKAEERIALIHDTAAAISGCLSEDGSSLSKIIEPLMEAAYGE